MVDRLFEDLFSTKRLKIPEVVYVDIKDAVDLHILILMMKY